MPTYNDTPTIWGSENIGKIKISASSGIQEYQTTPLDAILLGTMAAFEDQYPYLVIWALIQAFAGKKTYGQGGQGLNRTPSDSLARVAHAYSAPVNPVYAYTGEPTPDRATRGWNCAFVNGSNLEKGRTAWTGIGTGSLPPPGPNNIPPSPGRQIWNRVMCSRGTVNCHARDSNFEARRRRFDQIRIAMHGSSESERTQEWRRLTRTDDVRRAVWNILHGQAGNPIPGFDDWAACNRIRGKTRKVRVQTLDNLDSVQQRALNTVQQQSARERENHAIPFQFGRSNNCFLYHSSLRNRDDEVWIELNTGERIWDSRRANIDLSHLGSNGSTVSTATGVQGSGRVETTSQGLAPTSERPASSSVTDNTTNTANTTRNSESNRRFGTKEELFQQLEEWSQELEVTLSRELGRGIIRG